MGCNRLGAYGSYTNKINSTIKTCSLFFQVRMNNTHSITKHFVFLICFSLSFCKSFVSTRPDSFSWTTSGQPISPYTRQFSQWFSMGFTWGWLSYIRMYNTTGQSCQNRYLLAINFNLIITTHFKWHQNLPFQPETAYGAQDEGEETTATRSKQWLEGQLKRKEN